MNALGHDSRARPPRPAGLAVQPCAARRLALSTVLCSSMVIVIGPTPPGTGVMAEARSDAAANSTSPTSFF